MTNNTNFKPKKVTNPNDRLDEDGIWCIRGLLRHTQAIAHRVESHDKTPNIDGIIDLVDDEECPIGELTIQAKTYKSKYLGQNKADVPAYFVAYASIMRNKICVFFSVNANENKIYWKYISDEYIRDFINEGDNVTHVYQFKNDEILSTENVHETINRWKQIFNEKIALLIKEKKSAEEVMSESRSAFYRINSDFHDLKDSFIDRKEIGILYNWVKNELPKKGSNVKLLVGNAGVGKSVILKQVIQRLESDGIKCYAIKADKLLTPVGFTSNEHLEQLRNTFASLMQEERSVLIIDQIDALSQYINSDRSKLDNITTLIKLFSDNEDQRNVRIIVSCRSFDLEFDPKLSLLGHEPQVKLGLLDKKDVEKVLDRLKVGLYKELDEKTISVLQTPQHLNIFCRVYRKNEKKDYYSITELYDELWLQVIGLTEAKINKSVAEKILYDLALKIYRDEELTPQWDYDISELKEANYLISEGIIEKTGNRATFFHQSMYDYVFARYYTKEKRSLIQDLLTEKKHQGLFVRSTVNFVLDYERAKNIKQYKEDIKIIMFSGQIRTHIQFILLWALANRTEILPFEKKCINELYAHDSFLFYSFINHVGSKQWYDTIISIILTDLKELKDSSPSYNSICSFLCNNINHLLVEVFNAANLIKDEKTKESVIKQLLFYTHDFTQDIVLNWYQSLCKTIDQKIDFLEKAIESNYEFVLDNIGEIIDHELDPELEEKNRLIERGVEIICKSLTNNHFEKFYPLLKDRIINFYINQRVVYTKRPYYIRTNNTQSLLCDCHEMMLIKMVGYSPETVFEDIKKLISANEDNCYKVAFKAMIVNPILFSEDIMTIY